MTRLPFLGDWSEPETVAGVLRPIFMDTLARLVPSVLEALRDDVLPVYQRRCQQSGKRSSAADFTQSEAPATVDGEDLPRRERTIREHDPNPDPDLFTEEEAAALFEHSYQMLGDPVPEGHERFYVWRPDERQTAFARSPQDSCEDFDELTLYLTELTNALATWAATFNLADDCILQVARNQLAAWNAYWHLAYPHCRWPGENRPTAGSDPQSEAATPSTTTGHSARSVARAVVGPERLEWLLFPTVSWFLPTSAAERRLTYDHEGWDPTAAPRGNARPEILADFERFLDDYLDRMEETVSADCDRFQRTPEYYALHRHTEWLVRRKCLDHSFSAIARTDGVARKTVSDPVNTLAALLGLSLDRHRGGRPSDARDRAPRHRRSWAGEEFLLKLVLYGPDGPKR